MLELQNVSVIIDNKKILDNINLKFDETKFYCITGPNGSGKSTLAKVIMGIIKPTKGKIIYNGIDITKKDINKRAQMGISFAFQQPITFKGITVFDLLNFASEKILSKKEACLILSKVGLCALEYIDRIVDNSLSGGELKRIEIASIIARNPKVAIFDEPEAGIDLWSFQNLNNIFKDLEKNNQGITIVISHQERILQIADEIILLNDGIVVKKGNINDVVDLIDNKKCCKQVNYE